MDGGMILTGLFLFLGAVWFLQKMDEDKGIYTSSKLKKVIKKIVDDTEVSEKERRKSVASILANNGYIILSQSEGFIQYQQSKKKFSAMLFILLLLLGVIPGVIYAVWSGFRKQDLGSYTFAE